jgi:hypothetical protein
MTPEEWQRSDEPAKLLEFLLASGRASDRKLRLFAAAACRTVWELLEDSRLRRAVETSERHADHRADKEELRAAWWAAYEAAAVVRGTLFEAERRRREDSPGREFWLSKAGTDADGELSHLGSRNRAADGVLGGTGVVVDHAVRAVVARLDLCARSLRPLLGDIFGSLPFHEPPPLDPTVLTYNGGAAGRLAQSTYDSRCFEDLPVLADALEEAGCTDAALLGHLRGPGPHALGCHGLDAVLGKS